MISRADAARGGTGAFRLHRRPTSGLAEFEEAFVVWRQVPRSGPGTARSPAQPTVVVDKETGELTPWGSLPADLVATQYTAHRAARDRFPPDVRAALETAGWWPARDRAAVVTAWLATPQVATAFARHRLLRCRPGRCWPSSAACGCRSGCRAGESADGGFASRFFPIPDRVGADGLRSFTARTGIAAAPVGDHEDGPGRPRHRRRRPGVPAALGRRLPGGELVRRGAGVDGARRSATAGRVAVTRIRRVLIRAGWMPSTMVASASSMVSPRNHSPAWSTRNTRPSPSIASTPVPSPSSPIGVSLLCRTAPNAASVATVACTRPGSSRKPAGATCRPSSAARHLDAAVPGEHLDRRRHDRVDAAVGGGVTGEHQGPPAGPGLVAGLRVPAGRPQRGLDVRAAAALMRHPTSTRTVPAGRRRSGTAAAARRASDRRAHGPS